MNKTEKSLVTQGLKDKKGFQKLANELGVSRYYIRSIVRSLVTEHMRREYTSEYDGGLRVNKVTKKKVRRKKGIILSDIHIPFQDQAALAIAIAYTKDRKPDSIILNGDIIDCYAASKYLKDPLRIETLQDELDECKDFIYRLRKDNPKAKIAYISGNHEQRIEKLLIDKAPGMYGLRCLSLDQLLGLQDNDVTFVDDSVFLGNLEVTHGAAARQSPGGSVMSHFNKTGRSTLIGHIHKLNVNHRTTSQGVSTLVENGYLSIPDPEYMQLPGDWQQGFTEVDYCPETGDFEVSLRLIHDGKMTVDEVTYTA